MSIPQDYRSKILTFNLNFVRGGPSTLTLTQKLKGGAIQTEVSFTEFENPKNNGIQPNYMT